MTAFCGNWYCRSRGVIDVCTVLPLLRGAAYGMVNIKPMHTKTMPVETGPAAPYPFFRI